MACYWVWPTHALLHKLLETKPAAVHTSLTRSAWKAVAAVYSNMRVIRDRLVKRRSGGSAVMNNPSERRQCHVLIGNMLSQWAEWREIVKMLAPHFNNGP